MLDVDTRSAGHASQGLYLFLRLVIWSLWRRTARLEVTAFQDQGGERDIRHLPCPERSSGWLDSQC